MSSRVDAAYRAWVVACEAKGFEERETTYEAYMCLVDDLDSDELTTLNERCRASAAEAGR